MKDAIAGFIVGYIIYSFIGLFIGMLSVLAGEPTEGFRVIHECQYKSIASRTNVGYFIGCELFKSRF